MRAARCAVGLSLASLCVLVGPARLAADEPGDAPRYKLVYKATPGEELRWEIVHRGTIKTTIQGTTQTAHTRSHSTKLWKVEDELPTGEIAFTHLVESVKMENEISGRAKVEYDSQKDQEPPPGYEDVAKAVGVPLTKVRIDPRGKILDRTELRFRPAAGPEEGVAFPLPAEPVPVGHVWTEPQEMTVVLEGGVKHKVEARRRFELKDVKAGVATIGVSYQVLTPVRDPLVEVQLVQRISSGEARFDIDAGRVISQQMEIDKGVVGFRGPNSSMHYVMRLTERLITPGEKPVQQQAAKSIGPPVK